MVLKKVLKYRSGSGGKNPDMQARAHLTEVEEPLHAQSAKHTSAHETQAQTPH